AGGIVAIVVVLVGGMLWLGAEPFLSRVADSLEQAKVSSSDAGFLNRGGIWLSTLALIQQHKLFGVGLGAYETVYPAYNASHTEDIVMQAHNDYLQILADCGVIGGLLALWFLVMLFRAIWQALKSQDDLLAAVALGGSAGIFAILVHSLFDF